MNAAKLRFINENLDGDAPDLVEIARSLDLLADDVRRCADVENWYYQRNRNIAHFRSALTEEYDNTIRRHAIDLAEAQAAFIESSIELVRCKTKQIVDELDRRIHTMSDTNLISYLKLLDKMKNDLTELILARLKSAEAGESTLSDGTALQAYNEFMAKVHQVLSQGEAEDKNISKELSESLKSIDARMDKYMNAPIVEGEVVDGA